MTFHSGIASTATVNGTELPSTRWTVEPRVDIVEFKNSKTDAYAQKEATFKSCDFTIDLDYDFDANPFLVGPGLTIGTKLTDVKLYMQGGGTGGSGSYWSFPSAIITGTPMTSENEGKVTVTLNCTNDGTFSPPAA